ncbi:FCD domain-containing protein, partial [Escherichia coli]|uniref:FCD domain-containing protein n=1 Tax=Escherichia coli TaxID=562 RepID=UPI002FF09FCE
VNRFIAVMGALKEKIRRERWIEVDMAWHEDINEMSANPFLTSFASLVHSVYHTYFTSITSDTVIKLDLHQAIVDAIIQSDGDAPFKACQALLRSPDK